MKVLHLGGTGNLGLRVIPALLAHGHTVVAHVRSPEKLRGLLSPDILSQVSIIQGDALDSHAIASALRQHDCDAVVNTAGTREPLFHEQTLGKIVASITSAAIQVGKERGRPLRAWIIGGMGSLDYPGTGYKIQDYMPGFLTDHHRGTEAVSKCIRPVTGAYPQPELATLVARLEAAGWRLASGEKPELLKVLTAGQWNEYQ